MSNLKIELISTPEKLRPVQAFCRTFRLWLYDRYPDHASIIDQYYNPASFETLMAELLEHHSRPKGAILLASIDGVPAGSVMHQEIGAGVCEMKRLFVASFARGTGVGAALCKALMRLAKADGYDVMRLDTGMLQTEAQALYESLGFRRRTPYYEATIPPDFLIFYERDLE
jgi:ribosomal protein S18 acetylase RimI-like enzyme